MLTIRDAISEDAALIRALFQELAEYDREADQVRTTVAEVAPESLEAQHPDLVRRLENNENL